jgi:hypothetical protein
VTQAERDESEARRRLIARQSREANRPRPIRIIEPGDRNREILERTGLAVKGDDGPIDWKALTASG